MPSYGDPLSSLAAPTYGSCDFPNKLTIDSALANQYGGGPVPVTPGVYCGGIEVKAGKTAIFGPGLYVLKGGEFYIAGNATVTNTENASGGVTFYLTGTGGNYATLRFEFGREHHAHSDDLGRRSPTCCSSRIATLRPAAATASPAA